MMLCLLFAPVAAAAGPSPPTLFWASTALPGDTLVLGKSGYCTPPCTCEVSPAIVDMNLGEKVKQVKIEPAQVNNASLMLPLPASLPVGSYSITCGGSVPLVVNAPDVWWIQGDAGNVSTSGPKGWLRVFGRSIDLAPNDDTAARLSAHSMASDIAAAARRGDFEAVERLATAQAYAARSARVAAHQAVTPTLTLTNQLTDSVLPPITATNSSSVEALFLLNAVPPGTYKVTVSNGHANSVLDSFVSPAQPHLGTLTVVSAASVDFNPMIFAVSSYGCDGGVNGTGSPINCSTAVQAAIKAAGDNGGGTVFFGAGRWYVEGPLLLPQGVLLKGERMDLTAIYFSEFTSENQPGNHTAPASLITTDRPVCVENCTNQPDAPRFGVEDMAIYVLSYYQNVIDIRVDTVGVRVRRVRIRANAFHCQARSSEGGPGGGRAVPWQFEGGGHNPLFWIHGQNFEISDCDLWATWSVFHSSGPVGGRYGLMTRNRIYNGGSCHWFDNGRELIFEGNTCLGNNPMAMGNNIDSYGGGYAHHIYIGNNKISQVWGNDREVMTYDNAGNAYYGPIAKTDGTKLTIASGFDPKSHSYTNRVEGGAMVVVAGTGAGQYKRIVSWPGSIKGTSGVFEIDSPLAAPLDATSVVEVMPMRGKNIFHKTHYEDTGAFQFYGLGVDNMVVGMSMERGGGFANWGQSRGDPNHGPYSFVNPNLMNEFLGNTVVEGLRAEHQGSPLGLGTFGDPMQFNGHVFAIVDGAPDVNRYIVFRGNRAGSNGGFFIGGSSDVLVEKNEVSNTPNQSVSGQGHYYVSPKAQGVYLVGNQ